MTKLKKCRDLLQKIIEEIIPCILFCVLFIVFIVQVVMRYVFNNPLTWSLEVTSICYVWIVTLGACYAQRLRSHVSFTMLYDAMPEKKRHFLKMTGNSLIFVLFGLLYIPAIKYIINLKISKTAVLHLPFSVVYSPFIAFLSLILIYLLIEIIEDIKLLLKPEDKEIKPL